jgi:hypothetical protein
MCALLRFTRCDRKVSELSYMSQLIEVWVYSAAAGVTAVVLATCQNSF